VPENVHPHVRQRERQHSDARRDPKARRVLLDDGHELVHNRDDGLLPKPQRGLASAMLFDQIANQRFIDTDTFHEPTSAVTRSHGPDRARTRHRTAC
jgi:hypothetical protein